MASSNPITERLLAYQKDPVRYVREVFGAEPSGQQVSYLQAMEALPQRVLWGSVSLKVEQHPKSVLTLRVYTISRERHWLEI